MEELKPCPLCDCEGVPMGLVIKARLLSIAAMCEAIEEADE